MIRNADRVKIACIAQLVNVIAPIMTETGGPAWVQTMYWPLSYVSRFGHGISMNSIVSVPSYEHTRYKEVPYIDASALLSEDEQQLTLFLVNRHQTDRLPVHTNFLGFDAFEPIEWVELTHRDLKAKNTKDAPHTVKHKQIDIPPGETPALKPLSWNMIRFRSKAVS